VEGARKAALLAHARAYVSLSLHEGQPIAVLEAMASGRACVCSDIPAHRELLEGGRGLLRAASTFEERVEAVREACALADARRAELGEAARAHVRAAHDWDRVVDRLEAIYREIL
jgi:glycosyltransferase involved in cell wall biosynthesis